MIRTICIVTAAAVCAALLTLYFWLTPAFVIDTVNGNQGAVKVRAVAMSGDFVRGYRFSGFAVEREGTGTLYESESLDVTIRLLPFLRGRFAFSARTKECMADLAVGRDGIIDGQARFQNVPFRSGYVLKSDDFSFSAVLSGRLAAKEGRCDVEFTLDEIRWERFSFSGVSLPTNLFERARGGLTAEPGRIVVKSLTFEGARGNARLVGDIVKNVPKLDMELLPKNWDDLYLFPLVQYRLSPGFYRIPVSR